MAVEEEAEELVSRLRLHVRPLAFLGLIFFCESFASALGSVSFVCRVGGKNRKNSPRKSGRDECVREVTV